MAQLSPERRAARAALLGIGVSAAVAAIKIGAGLVARSVAVVSDGLESASDCFTSGIVYVGLRVAARPADEDHPYGHGRFEILAGLAVGVLLAVIGTVICVRSIEQRDAPHQPETFAVWVILGSIAIKGALAAFKNRTARKTGSAALSADSRHDFVDLLSGMVALVAVLLAIFFPALHAADHWGGFAIGVIVIFLGLHVVRDTTLQLMDTMPDEAQMEQIRKAALRVPGALGGPW